MNILAVDDEAGSRTSLDVVLKLAGHRAIFARDGDEALEKFNGSEVPFDLIITDHQMARVSGLDLVRSLRGKGFTGEIVVLTAYTGKLDEQEYKKLEVAGIMEKPFDVAELRQWLDYLHKCPGESMGEKPASASRKIDLFWLKPDRRDGQPINPEARPSKFS